MLALTSLQPDCPWVLFSAFCINYHAEGAVRYASTFVIKFNLFSSYQLTELEQLTVDIRFFLFFYFLLCPQISASKVHLTGP